MAISLAQHHPFDAKAALSAPPPASDLAREDHAKHQGELLRAIWRAWYDNLDVRVGVPPLARQQQQQQQQQASRSGLP